MAKKVEKLSERETECVEQMQRLQAEFENFQKRTEKEKADIVRNANEDLIVKLLGVLDNFELALRHTEDEGVRMIYSELFCVLEKEGLRAIDVSGDFDPRFHEALVQEDGEEDGKIVEELLRGYTLNEKVIRASKVKISKIAEDKNE